MEQARILCIGTDSAHLIEIVSQLDSELEIVVVACPEEGNASLLEEPPFDIIIFDAEMRGVEGALFHARLRAHSPGAERVAFVAKLRAAVSDAIQRHHARLLARHS